MTKHRLFLIDFMRIICAFFIYARHSIGMYGCTYGHTLDALFQYMTSPVMTCFFIISGFSIHYQHEQEEMSACWIKEFLKKRFLAIMPSYLLVVLIYPLVYPSQIKDWGLLLPVDLLGLQTIYRSLFGILHNGGTWFVSCLFLCYLVYPIIKAVLTSVKNWIPIIIIVISHFVLMYSNIIIPHYSLDSLYSNPISRAGEFMIGVCFAHLLLMRKSDSENMTNDDVRKSIKFYESWGFRIAFTIIVLFLISFSLSLLSNSGKRIMVFGYLVIPTILVLILFSYFIRSRFFENSKLLAILSGMSYQFFLMQLFLWNITSFVMRLFHLQGNKAKILMSFFICTLGAFIIFWFYDRPVRRFLKKRCIN